MYSGTMIRSASSTLAAKKLACLALAFALMHAAGTTAALGQTTASRKAAAEAAQAAKAAKDAATSGTATFTNTPPAATPPTGQPGMAAMVGGKAQPATPAPATPAAAKPKADPTDIKLQIDENNIVDLHVNDEDLSAVLEMLSIQSQRNIVASKSVSARVTANLYGVTFYEALEAILNVNGYGFVEEGNFIYVYTLDEIATIQKQSRQRVSKVITLSYIASVDAAEFVKPLLSDTGQIKTNGKTAGFPSMGDTPQGNEEYALASSIVVYDFEDNVAEIEALVKQIDTRPSQVLVEATILQTSLNEANAFGVDFAIVGNMAFGDFLQVGGPLSGPNALLGGKNGSTALPADGGGSALSSTVGNTAGAGGVKVGVVSNDVAVFLRMLDEVTDSTVLSNPKLLALNRQAGRVLVGRKVGYLNTTSTNTATTQTVEFLDTGTQLYFRPFVDTVQRTIRMELKPQVSEAVIRDVKDSSGAAVTIPDEITNELSTNVIVRDGQTIVLGGLFRESTTATRRQWPLLGDIPLIGSAFRGNEDETQRSEIIFLITPSIVDDTAMASAGENAKKAIDQAQAGARNGVLKWSRDRITSQLNVEAEKLASEGQTEKALWKLERSLSLDPSQPEVIAMRERLTGVKTQSSNRSLIDRILHKEHADNAKKAADASGTTPPAATTTTTTPVADATPATDSTTQATVPETANAPIDASPEAPAPAPSEPTLPETSPSPSINQGLEQGLQPEPVAPTPEPNADCDSAAPTLTPVTTTANQVDAPIAQPEAAANSEAAQPAEPTPVTSILFLQSYQQEVYQQAWLSPFDLLASWYGTDSSLPVFTQVPDSGDDQ